MLHLKSVRGNEALVISGPSLAPTNEGRPADQPQIKRSGRKWVLGCGLNKVSRIPLDEIAVGLDSVGARNAQGIRLNVRSVAKVRIMDEDSAILTASELFGRKPDALALSRIVRPILEARQRSLIAKVHDLLLTADPNSGQSA